MPKGKRNRIEHKIGYERRQMRLHPTFFRIAVGILERFGRRGINARTVGETAHKDDPSRVRSGGEFATRRESPRCATFRLLRSLFTGVIIRRTRIGTRYAHKALMTCRAHAVRKPVCSIRASKVESDIFSCRVGFAWHKSSTGPYRTETQTSLKAR